MRTVSRSNHGQQGRAKQNQVPIVSGLISAIIKYRPPLGAITGDVWPGTMETKAKAMAKWFGITKLTRDAEDWQDQPAFVTNTNRCAAAVFIDTVNR